MIKRGLLLNNQCKKCNLILKSHTTVNRSEPYLDPTCRFKNQSEKARDELNEKLYQLGIGGYKVNRNCDLIDAGNQDKCPEFEQK